MIPARSGGSHGDRKSRGPDSGPGDGAHVDSTIDATCLRARCLPIAAFALAVAACVGPRDAPSSKPHRELTAEEFRDLLAKGTIRPVVAMEGEDAFAGATERGLSDFR